MKEPLSFEAGRVVESTQGRDRGRCFIVIERISGDSVLTADGMTHRLSAPKKKKIKSHSKTNSQKISLNQRR